MVDINPHCETPFLSKETTQWYIQFWYRDSIGRRKKYKRAYKLNSPQYVKKLNGSKKEINKGERKKYADILITSMKSQLTTQYFNPENIMFESLDKADKPLIDFLESYLDHVPRKRREESTKNIYRSYNNVIGDWLESKGNRHISLRDVNREMIVEFLDLKEERSVSHRDNYLVYLKGVFDYCVNDLEVLEKNPLKKLHKINDHDSDTNKAYRIDDLVERILPEVKKLDYFLWLLMRMVFNTLRRPSEILALRYRDIDLNTGKVDFDSSIVKTNRKLHSTLQKSLVDELKMGVASDVKSQFFLFGHAFRRSGERYQKRIFGEYQTPYGHFQDKFKVLQRKLKLEDGYTIYSMKHTGIVYLMEVEKLTDKEIIAITGHTDTSILGRYSRDAKKEVKSYTSPI